MSDLTSLGPLRGRDFILGETAIAAGAITTTIEYPGPGHDFFIVLMSGTWPLGTYETARTGKTLTVSWTVPAPPPTGGVLKWVVFI